MDYSFLKIEQHDQITVMKVSAPKSLNALNSTVLTFAPAIRNRSQFFGKVLFHQGETIQDSFCP